MKNINIRGLKLVYLFVIGTVLGCGDSLTNLNISPNELSEEDINPAYVLTNILSHSAAQVSEWALTGNPTQSILSEAAQFTQQDYSEFEKSNAYAWIQKDWAYRDFYKPLANCSKLKEISKNSPDSMFLRATALTMSSYWFGFYTSAWGDVPYREAFQGNHGINNPVFDDQIDIFAGILSDLELANDLFSRSSQLSGTTIESDILYQGEILKWRAFANSLRLRFLMRLSEKSDEMQAKGVDVKADFKKIVNNEDKYPIILSHVNNAKVDFLGNTAADSWKLGPLNTTNNPLEFYRRKGADPLISFLIETNDPRLTVWFSPVEIPTRIGDKGGDGIIVKDNDGVVRRYYKNYSEDIDTSLYVGLKVAYPNPISYNKNSGALIAEGSKLKPDVYTGSSANPFASYLNRIYQENSHPLVNTVFMPSFEVHFILAEAVERNWINGTSLEHYLKGIKESLNQYDINDGDIKHYNSSSNKIDEFDLDSYLQGAKERLENSSNPIAIIMEQHWSSHFSTTDMEAWFNWRRTGYPSLEENIVNGSNGKKLPLRFPYGDNPKNFNRKNVDKGVQNLSPAIDDQWSKMWLLR